MYFVPSISWRSIIC